MRIASATLALLATAPAVLAACVESDPCDSTSEYRNGGCYPRPSPQGDGGDPEGGAGDGAAPSDGSPGDASPGGKALGDACNDGVAHSDCAPPAAYCAKQPGSPTGYCTATGCDVTPSLCPPGWACLDLGRFGAGLPHICAKP